METLTERQSLGELMKAHEHAFRRTLDKEDYVLLRLDGKNFHSYCKNLIRPFDQLFIDAMDFTAEALCNQIQGVRFAYTQSDEISILLTGFKNIEPNDSNPSGVQQGELFMGGVEAKILSIAAAIATSQFNLIREDQLESLLNDIGTQFHESLTGQFHSGPALFDARLWTFPGNDEGRSLVQKYFMWRQRDCFKNSVTMAALNEFSHKELHQKNTNDKLDMMSREGVYFDEYPARSRFGAAFEKTRELKTVSYVDKRDMETKTIEVESAVWSKFSEGSFVRRWNSENLPFPIRD